ncbi:MAG TPA: hypothetical protein VIK81_00660 [Patescibacteria group bacterium]
MTVLKEREAQVQTEIIRPQSLSHWIAEDPQRAIDFAKEILPPFKIPTFQLYVLGTMENGLNSFQIASALGKKQSSYDDEIKNCRSKIADALNFPVVLLREPRLIDLYKEKQAKKEFFKAKNGNLNSMVKIAMLGEKELNKFSRQLPESLRTQYLIFTTSKILTMLPRIEWQGFAQLTSWLRSTFHSCYLDYRKMYDRQHLGKNTTPLFTHPPTDLLVLWRNKHPQRAKVIIDSMSPMRKEVYRLSQNNIPHERIKEISGSSSARSVKVLVLEARREFTAKAKIKIPSKYKVLTEFADSFQEAERMRSAIKAGKIKGVLLFNGKYHITRNIYESHIKSKSN